MRKGGNSVKAACQKRQLINAVSFRFGRHGSSFVPFVSASLFEGTVCPTGCPLLIVLYHLFMITISQVHGRVSGDKYLKVKGGEGFESDRGLPTDQIKDRSLCRGKMPSHANCLCSNSTNQRLSRAKTSMFNLCVEQVRTTTDSLFIR